MYDEMKPERNPDWINRIIWFGVAAVLVYGFFIYDPTTHFAHSASPKPISSQVLISPSPVQHHDHRQHPDKSSATGNNTSANPGHTVRHSPQQQPTPDKPGPSPSKAAHTHTTKTAPPPAAPAPAPTKPPKPTPKPTHTHAQPVPVPPPTKPSEPVPTQEPTPFPTWGG